MPGRVILFLGMLLCCASLAAQAPAASTARSSSASKGKAKANPAEAEVALDSAKRWTQAALEDDSNLLPTERDLLLVRLAASWKDADHAQAQEYLMVALSHLRSAAPDTPVAQSQRYLLVTSISNELHSVDSNAWEELIATLPKYAAADTISREAQELIDSNDIKGAMELEKKSLDRGGSESDANTLDWMIQSDSGEAEKLFDQILSTAAKPESDPNLLLVLAQNAFSDREDPEVQTFFNGERQKRLLDLLGQVILSGNDAGGCTYTSLITPFMSRFSQDQQDQLRAVARNCSEVAKSALDTRLSPDAGTDEIVQAMEEAPDAQSKERLREWAVRRASEKDQDYFRALQLCLAASQAELDVMSGRPDRFNQWAAQSAVRGIRVALRNHDDMRIQRLLDILPSGMRAEVEVQAVRDLSKANKQKAVQMLNDARRILEDDASIQIGERGCKLLMLDIADLAPADMTSGWRTMVMCLNQAERLRRMKYQATRTAVGNSGDHPVDPLYPLALPPAAMADESFARASIEDLDSVAYREELRLGVIGTFLESYQTAIKANQAGSAVAATDSKK